MSNLVVFQIQWGWLFAALVLGIIIGWTAWEVVRARWADKWVWLPAALIGVVVLAAIGGALPGRWGHWLHFAMILVFVCEVGSLIGWGLRDVAEMPTPPEAVQALVATRGAAGSAASYEVWSGTPETNYLGKPGQAPFFLPGAGIVHPRDAVAMWAAHGGVGGSATLAALSGAGPASSANEPGPAEPDPDAG